MNHNINIDTDIDIHRRFVFAPVCRGVTSKRSSTPTAPTTASASAPVVKNPDILKPQNVQLGQDSEAMDPEVANYLKFLFEKELNEEMENEAEDELR